MPTYPLTLPTAPTWRSVKAKPVFATVRSENPFGLNSKAIDWMGESAELELELPPMKEGDANIDAWVQFFFDLKGSYGTFTADLSRYFPGQTGWTAVTLSLVSNMDGWNVPKNLTFGMRFRARIAQ